MAPQRPSNLATNILSPAHQAESRDDADRVEPSRGPGKIQRPHLYVTKVDKTDDDSTLGQFIPIHYHYQMLDQEPRIGGFEQAIAAVVTPGMKVVDLGLGTGVMSFFAARAGAAKVYGVERIPHVARAAQKFLAKNGMADRVDVIQADAMGYMPPEPVDVVICEMLHSAMLREKQMAVIASFKARYAERFPNAAMPRFIPEGAVMAMQLVDTNFEFHGYSAPVPMFVDAANAHRITPLAMPMPYAMFLYESDYAMHFPVDMQIAIETSGTVSGIKFITKNLLAIIETEGRSIDWDMYDLVIPLANPVDVAVGDILRIRFRYDAGDSILALAESIDGT